MKRILVLSLTAVFLAAALLVLYNFTMQRHAADVSAFFAQQRIPLPRREEKPALPPLPAPRSAPRPQPRTETI